VRRRQRTSDPPERLVTFGPDDGWPGVTPADRHAAWIAARCRWAEAHGWADDDGPDGIDAARQAPDEPWRPDAV
jgi:hypothetical protein